MPKVQCSSCQKKLRIPDHLAGKRVTCPRCEAVLKVPLPSDSSPEMPTMPVAAPRVPEDPPLPSSARIGIIALGLGCASVLVLCLPFVGYVSFALSSIGLPLGLYGLLQARSEEGIVCRSLTGGVGLTGTFGTRVRDYPLAGTAACLLALALTLFPLLLSGE